MTFRQPALSLLRQIRPEIVSYAQNKVAAFVRAHPDALPDGCGYTPSHAPRRLPAAPPPPRLLRRRGIVTGRRPPRFFFFSSPRCMPAFELRNCFVPDIKGRRFDGIHVGASCPESRVRDLVALLKPGGRLVVPVESDFRFIRRSSDPDDQGACGGPQRRPPGARPCSRRWYGKINEWAARIPPILPAQRWSRTRPRCSPLSATATSSSPPDTRRARPPPRLLPARPPGLPARAPAHSRARRSVRKLVYLSRAAGRCLPPGGCRWPWRKPSSSTRRGRKSGRSGARSRRTWPAPRAPRRPPGAPQTSAPSPLAAPPQFLSAPECHAPRFSSPASDVVRPSACPLAPGRTRRSSGGGGPRTSPTSGPPWRPSPRAAPRSRPRRRRRARRKAQVGSSAVESIRHRRLPLPSR